MAEFFRYAADIIRAAAENPLGIVALVILTLAVLAYLFFGKSDTPVRLGVYLLLGLGGVLTVSVVIATIVDPPPPPPPLVTQYCCDIWGNRRCPMVTPGLFGGSCVCPGQGWGTICG